MTDGYELIDAGAGRRLERFGERIVDRPAPAATDLPRDLRAWQAADLRFDRDAGWWVRDGAIDGWRVADDGIDGWPIAIDGLTMELRPTPAGGLGLFPEHAGLLPWLRAQVAGLGPLGSEPPLVLHLFAHTGLATLALAAAGAAVAHVDAARPSVAWARRNAALSGHSDAPIRWLVDDAAVFVAREARRGRRYAGIVLDPPSYGHGPGGQAARLEAALPGLLAACAAIAEPDAFVLLTAHTPGFDGQRLRAELVSAFGEVGGRLEAGELAIDAASGAALRLGAFARIMGS